MYQTEHQAQISAEEASAIKTAQQAELQSKIIQVELKREPAPLRLCLVRLHMLLFTGTKLGAVGKPEKGVYYAGQHQLLLLRPSLSWFSLKVILFFILY